MKFIKGSLMLEEGELLHVVDTFETVTYMAKSGHDCGICVFYGLCDKRKDENKIAKFCKETHFVEVSRKKIRR